jgi:hypothetical protein
MRMEQLMNVRSSFVGRSKEKMPKASTDPASGFSAGESEIGVVIELWESFGRTRLQAVPQAVAIRHDRF